MNLDLGTLATGIAHDLNNILQVIITNLDLANSAPSFDERLPKYLDDASRGADGATNLAKCFTTKPRGSGLGLATVKSAMQQHGGSIAIASLVGRGTTVSLLLPAAAHRPERPEASRPSPVVKTTGRILVIDDDEMILSVVDSMLSSLGYNCAVAKDGVEGCDMYIRAKADGNPFAAVLLDATIPNGLAGEEALKFLLQADPQ